MAHLLVLLCPVVAHAAGYELPADLQRHTVSTASQQTLGVWLACQQPYLIGWRADAVQVGIQASGDVVRLGHELVHLGRIAGLQGLAQQRCEHLDGRVRLPGLMHA